MEERTIERFFHCGDPHHGFARIYCDACGHDFLLKPKGEETVSWRPEVIEVAPPPVSKELKKRWSYFIRKVYETDPLTCPKCQGEMAIISFIDQPAVIQKILKHLGLWEESHAPPERSPPGKELTFDPSYSLSQRLIRLRWKVI